MKRDFLCCICCTIVQHLLYDCTAHTINFFHIVGRDLQSTAMDI